MSGTSCRRPRETPAGRRAVPGDSPPAGHRHPMTGPRSANHRGRCKGIGHPSSRYGAWAWMSDCRAGNPRRICRNRVLAVVVMVPQLRQWRRCVAPWRDAGAQPSCRRGDDTFVAFSGWAKAAITDVAQRTSASEGENRRCTFQSGRMNEGLASMPSATPCRHSAAKPSSLRKSLKTPSMQSRPWGAGGKDRKA